MIRYSLVCDAGHRFESWFHNGAAFDELADRGLVSCPTCASSNVAKAIMAPSVVSQRAAPVPAAASEPQASIDVSLLDQSHIEMRSFIKAFREKVLSETRDVGARFPDEARRMHDGEIPQQQIRGQASPEEARGLLEDGIMILPIPTLPDELN